MPGQSTSSDPLTGDQDEIPPDDDAPPAEDDGGDEDEAPDGPAATYEAEPDAPTAAPADHGWEANG